MISQGFVANAVHGAGFHPCEQAPTARARATDPDSSHMAAAGVEMSGDAEKQRDACLRAVMRSPGLTAAEIAREIGAERHMPSRRLPELRTAGKVRNGEDRHCRVQKRTCMTWWPT